MKKRDFLPKVDEELRRYELDNYYDLLDQAMDNINSMEYDDIPVKPKVYVEELLKKNEIEPKLKEKKDKSKNAKMGIFASLLFIVFSSFLIYNYEYLAEIEIIEVVCAAVLFFIMLGTFINLIKGYSSVYTFTAITTLTLIAIIMVPNVAFLGVTFLILVFGCINLFESIRYRAMNRSTKPIDLSSFTQSEMLEIKMNFGARNLNITDNIRYLKLKSNFGKVHVNATDITDDLLIDLRGSFGQVVIDLPEDAKVIDNSSVSFGTSKHSSENGEGPTIVLAGKFRFGSIEY